MDETEYERLLGSTIRLVSFRPRSEREIREYCTRTLKKHHTTAPILIERVIVRLAELGYVDDNKFVEWWISQRSAFKPKGRRAIEIELRAKGVSKQCIDGYFSGRNQSGDERDMAKKAISRKLVIWQHVPLDLQRKKLFGFLSRRGFDADVIASVVDDALGKE